MNAVRQEAIYKLLVRNTEDMRTIRFGNEEDSENRAIHVCSYLDPKVSRVRGIYLCGYFCLSAWMHDMLSTYEMLKKG